MPTGTTRQSTPEKERQSDQSSSGEEEERGRESETGSDEDVDTEEEGEEGQVCGQVAEKQLESAITVYLRRVCSRQDMAPITKVTHTFTSQTHSIHCVCMHGSTTQMLKCQLDAKYLNSAVYAEVKGLQPFVDYMKECVRVAWALCIQTPHMTINCSEMVYKREHHKRFYNADKSRKDILMYMWPILTQFNGPVLVQGIVLT